VYVELAFNLLAAFRGFQTAQAWTGVLAANGFRDVCVYPDVGALRAAFPQFVVAAISARRA
jgi:hypothetical protein